MANWVIWYTDGSSFSDEDGPPENAPRIDVQCIAVADISCGRYIMAEQNYYCYHFDIDQWVPHDNSGLWQYLVLPGKEKVVLQGYWAGRDQYIKVRCHALDVDDGRLPRVTAGPPRQPEGI